MNWEAVIAPAFCSRLCFALLHSFWFVALLAIATRAADYALRRRSVRMRYAVYTAGLSVSLGALPFTFSMVEVTAGVPPAKAIHRIAMGPDHDGESLHVGDNHVKSRLPHAARAQTVLLQPTPYEAVDPERPSSNPWPVWSRWSPWVAGIYVAGVLAMLVRLMGGIGAAHRLCRRAETIHEGPLVDLLHSVATRWSMRVVPRLARAQEIVVPKVIGLVRPTILLPMSATMGLSTDDLTMILTHELAHVRRYDLWVNLLQRLAETVLFFNPAVWYISRRISTLREYCCDEMACEVTAETCPQPRVRYASALLRVAELSRENNARQTSAGERSELATLAASGRSPSELRRRVAHLFGEPIREPLRLSRGSLLVLIAMTALLLTGPVVWQSDADTASAQVTETEQGDSPPRDQKSPNKAKTADSRKAAAVLHGSWAVQSIIHDGEKRPLEFEYYHWIFDSKKMTSSTRWKNRGPHEKENPLSTKRFAVNPSKSPKELTIYGNNMLIQAIYELNGEQMKVGMYGRSQFDRPTSFVPKNTRKNGSPLIVFFLKKIAEDDQGSRKTAEPVEEGARDKVDQHKPLKKTTEQSAANVTETKAESKQSAVNTYPITVKGHALDKDGNAIFGAKIYLASPCTNNKPLAITETNQDGSYRFNKVALPITSATTNKGQDTGSFEVFGETDGHGFAWRPLKSFFPNSEHKNELNWFDMDKRDLPTRYGRLDPINLDLTFGEEAKIRGRIVDDRGQPIANAILAIRQCDPEWDQDNFNSFRSNREFESLNERALVPLRIKVRHTDSQGRFEFDKLPASCRFWIDVRPPGHTPRNIWAVTRARAKEDVKGNRVYSGDFEAVFARPRRIKLRVVYGDTGKPAPKVGVGGMVVEASFWETTDKDGFVEVPLPDGHYQLSFSPRYRTPYLRTEFEVVVSAETAERTTTVKLRPAAVVDITIRDADTGNPLAGVDLWIDKDIPGNPQPFRTVHGYHSWEVETRTSHYESPRSDKNGKMRALFAPGKHRIGVGLETFPEGYEAGQSDGQIIECQPGKPIAVEFRPRRTDGANKHSQKNSALNSKAKITTDPNSNEAKRTLKSIGPSANDGQNKPLKKTTESAAAKDNTGVPKNKRKQFELLVRGPDGQPVPRANIELRTKPFPAEKQIIVGKFIRVGTYGPFVQTDEKGRLVLELLEIPSRFNVSIKKAGYGPYWAGWNSEEHPQSIPAAFVADLDAGWSIGGVVVDSRGQPIEGVKVSPSVHFKKRPGDTDQLGVGTRIKTDSKGRWRFDTVPVSETDIHVALSHPDYGPLRKRLPRSGFEVKRNAKPTGRIELQRGLTVIGKVTDESGKPIVGALVKTKFLNDVRKAKTNKQGLYRLVGCEPRMARIVVSAKGRATDMQEIRVESGMAPVDFSMKPGGKIRIRVVDEQGRGIPNARIFFQRWRGMFDYFEFGHVSQYADKNGIWEWNEAPLDEFQADICRPDGMQLSEQSLIAREKEYVFTPPRALVVSGSVVDAKTKKPIKKFRVIPGLRNSDPGIRMNWIQGNSYEASDGKYRIRWTHDYLAHLVRIEADGYQVAISRDIKTDEGNVDFDFELQPAKDIAATIFSVAGKPAANAKIALGVAGSQISVKKGDIDDGSTYATRLNADVVGRFHFPARSEPFQLVITHPFGFAYLKSADGPIPSRITLTPWARVEGTFRVGTQPAPNVVLSMSVGTIHSYGDDVPNIYTHHNVTTDEEGRFVFERVFPGIGRVGRRIPAMVDEGATEITSSLNVSAEFIAGKTTKLSLGGTGRLVVGKLAPPADFFKKVLWNFAFVNIQADLKLPPTPTAPADVRNDPDKRKVWWNAWKASPEGKAWALAGNAYEQLRLKSPYIMASVDRDGSFHIDDMPAGNYVLSVFFSENAAGTLSGYHFSVLPVERGRATERLELGTLTLDKP